MADLEKQLADLENAMSATEKPTLVAGAVQQQPQTVGVAGKQIQQAVNAAKVTIPMYFYGIIAAIPLIVIGALYFAKPKLVYRKKKFIIQDFIKLTVLISIALWILVAVIMYFGGFISTT